MPATPDCQLGTGQPPMQAFVALSIEVQLLTPLPLPAICRKGLGLPPRVARLQSASVVYPRNFASSGLAQVSFHTISGMCPWALTSVPGALLVAQLWACVGSKSVPP